MNIKKNANLQPGDNVTVSHTLRLIDNPSSKPVVVDLLRLERAVRIAAQNELVEMVSEQDGVVTFSTNAQGESSLTIG